MPGSRGRGENRRSLFSVGKKHLGLLFLAALFVFLAGCGEASVREEKGPPIIGVSINSLRSPFMIALAQGIREEAEEMGVELIMLDCNGDLPTQANQIRDFISREVDGILMEPLDEDALIRTVEAAAAADIPVYCIDTTVNSEKVACTISSDNLAMGRMAASYIASLLYEKYGAYRGKVVNLLVSVNTTSGRNRSRGFHEVMDQYPEIEIVAEQNGALQLDTAYYAATNVLQANPELDAVWCSGDTNAQGVLQAMRWLDRLVPAGEEGHILLVSADGAAESLAAIRDGSMDACISQNPLGMGRLAVQTMVEHITGGTEPETSFVSYPLYEIRRDNIDTEEHRNYGIWSEEIEK